MKARDLQSTFAFPKGIVVKGVVPVQVEAADICCAVFSCCVSEDKYEVDKGCDLLEVDRMALRQQSRAECVPCLYTLRHSNV